jgi:hypothetical protein
VCRLRELGQQPSKLSEFIALKLRVKEVVQLKEDVAVLRPGQVTAMYATATDWSSSCLPHTDQVTRQGPHTLRYVYISLLHCNIDRQCLEGLRSLRDGPASPRQRGWQGPVAAL